MPVEIGSVDERIPLRYLKSTPSMKQES